MSDSESLKWLANYTNGNVEGLKVDRLKVKGLANVGATRQAE